MAIASVTMNNGTDFEMGDVVNPTNGLISSEGVVDLDGGHFEVTEAATPGKNVVVSAGEGYVDNSNYATGNGNIERFFVQNDNGVTVTIPDNTSGNPRVDIICAKVDPAASVSTRGINAGSFVAITGTPAAVPTATAVPANHLLLSTVTASNGFSSITNANIDDKRTQVKFNNFNFDEPTLDNNKFFRAENSSGTAKDLIGLDSADDVQVGEGNNNVINRDKNKIKIYLSSNQLNLVNNTPTTIAFDTVDGTDYNSLATLASNSITIKKAGWYVINASVRFDNVVANKRYQADILTGSTRLAFAIASIGSDTGVINVPVSAQNYLNVGDVITIEATSTSGTNTVDIGGGIDDTWVALSLIGNPAT